MGTTTHKIKTSMRGFKKWMDAHPRKGFRCEEYIKQFIK